MIGVLDKPGNVNYLDQNRCKSCDINNPNIDRYLINQEPIPLNYDSEDEDDTNTGGLALRFRKDGVLQEQLQFKQFIE